MLATILHKGKDYKIDFFSPIDISIPLHPNGPRAWYVDPMRIEPVKNGDWVGEVAQGGSVNFRNIWFNPHGHGTHTENVGHISKEHYSVNKSFDRFMFVAELVTVLPQQLENGDYVISRKQLEEQLEGCNVIEALVVRTLSNGTGKLAYNYSNTNPPYFEKEAIDYLNEKGVLHLLTDMPSVDKEVDGGLLAAHHAFWNYPQAPLMNKTITEFIYVPNDVFDGTYILQMQIAPFENDATPSKPVLYKVF